MKQKRYSKKTRQTKETEITVEVSLDGKGKGDINTGIGFFDHMLNHIAKQGFIDLKVKAQGDLHIDTHHTVEDTGIVLGQCLTEAFGEKKGIKRYGFAGIPMDETLVYCSVDLSGRSYLKFNAPFTAERIGDLETEMIEEFFRSLTSQFRINCHIDVRYGRNNHHIAEGIFKAFGKALDEAKTVDLRIDGSHSTKGCFDV